MNKRLLILVVLALVLALVVGAGARVALNGRADTSTERTAGDAREPQTEGESVRGKATAGTPRPLKAILNVPALRLRVEVTNDLDNGPAWWPITGRPGGGDTIAIAGHRTTHSRPFRYLNRLRPGDVIWLSGRRYIVNGWRILSAKNLHIADAVGYERLLLTACHPLFSAKQRIVVYAREAS